MHVMKKLLQTPISVLSVLLLSRLLAYTTPLPPIHVSSRPRKADPKKLACAHAFWMTRTCARMCTECLQPKAGSACASSRLMVASTACISSLALQQSQHSHLSIASVMVIPASSELRHRYFFGLPLT